MSKRARAVGKKLATNCNLTQILDSNSDLPSLIAPFIVSTCAVAAASMRSQCKSMRDAVDVSIVSVMRLFNTRYMVAQVAFARNEGYRARGAPRGGQEADAEEVAKRLKEDEQNEKDVVVLADCRAHARRMFGEAGEHVLFKSLPGLDAAADEAGAIDLRAARGSRPYRSLAASDLAPEVRALFEVGHESVHFYLAMAAHRCEVHSCKGRCCRMTSGLLLNMAPGGLIAASYCSVDGMRVEAEAAAAIPVFRALYANQECIRDQCVLFNGRSSEPLKLTMCRAPQTVLNNNNLCKAMLRHVGVSAPFSAPAVRKRMGGDIYDRYVELKPGHSGANPNVQSVPLAFGAGVDEDEGVQALADALIANPGNWRRRFRDRESHKDMFRFQRPLWLLDHPTMPSGYSLQSRLRVAPMHVQLAVNDIRREIETDRKIKEFTRKAKAEKLLEDFNALIALDSTGVDLKTIEDIDNMYPGTKACAEKLMDLFTGSAHEHALDVEHTRAFTQIIHTMIGHAARYDRQFTGMHASGYAYTYVNGIAMGFVPGYNSVKVAQYLINDPVLERWDQGQWYNLVLSMHAFDALTWNNMDVRKTPIKHRSGVGGGGAGSSSDPIDTEALTWAPVTWTITFGSGCATASASGMVAPPVSRAEWLSMASRCEKRLDDADSFVEQGLPAVPSQAHIDLLVTPDDPAEVALHWLKVMAQTMVFLPETRAMGLDILTNNSTRAFINAMGESGIDIVHLSAEGANKQCEGQPL